MHKFQLSIFPVNNCIAIMEVGCLRHPGASTISSQLLDEDCSNGWQIAMSPNAGTGTRHTVETVERGRERGGRGTASDMRCHTTKKKTPKTHLVRMPHYDPQARGNLTHAQMCRIPLTTRRTLALRVVISVKLHLTSLNFFFQLVAEFKRLGSTIVFASLSKIIICTKKRR